MKARYPRTIYVAALIALLSCNFCGSFLLGVEELSRPRSAIRHNLDFHVLKRRSHKDLRLRHDVAQDNPLDFQSMVLFSINVNHETSRNDSLIPELYFAKEISGNESLSHDENDHILAAIPVKKNGAKLADAAKEKLNFSMNSLNYSHSAAGQGDENLLVGSKLVGRNEEGKDKPFFTKPQGMEISQQMGDLVKEVKETSTEEKKRALTDSVTRAFSPVQEFLTRKGQPASNRAKQPDGLVKDSSSAVTNLDDQSAEEAQPERLPIRRLWSRRHARTIDEGIRRQKATKLSNLLNKVQIDARLGQNKRYIERTLMGLINALADEVEDLDVEFNTIGKTPLWRKELKEVRINFSRLGFKPIRMGGSSKYDEIVTEIGPTNTKGDTELSLVECADEAFDRIDKDNSGTLDRKEIAEALSMITPLETDRESINELASELIDLYDENSDGVVDRQEYQLMIEDMARLRPGQMIGTNKKDGPLMAVQKSVRSFSKEISEKAAQVASSVRGSGSAAFDPDEREMGSITLSNLNLDLRRLIFGGIPIIKKITPGGPLILEPFTATLKGSFSREDVMGSFLLDSGLRLLVARVLRVRVRSFRDFVDGAYFFGRRWTMTSKKAPVVQVLGLSNVEFDKQDKMILTGRARVRTGPDAPVVTNTFKVRTKIGTGMNGQSIRLVEPELAFVFECPKAWENGLGVACELLGMPQPKRPEPVYSFFPIYSPFKVNDQNAGFNMGEDNRLRNIFIKDGKLRFEMRSVLRPGRFLGNHYLAFTLPSRTFIITMDRFREGIRAARKNKKIADLEKKLRNAAPEYDANVRRRFSLRRAFKAINNAAKPGSALRRRLAALILINKKKLRSRPKSFFTRFVEGYTLVEREGEANNERLTNDISDWFGRQGSSSSTEDSNGGDGIDEVGSARKSVLV